MTHSAPAGPALPRRLGLGGAVAIGLGAMLGTGVFAAWTPALDLAGSALLVALAIATLVAALNAWSTAALARVHPEAGGAYAYGRARLHPAAGIVAGWAFVIGKAASAGAAALTIGAYLLPAQQRLVGVAAIVVVLALDLRGVTRTAIASAVASAIVIITLAIVVVAATSDTFVNTTTPASDPDSVWGVLGASGLLFVAFAGYARIATLGEEVRQPARNLPRAITWSFAVVLVTYVAVALCVLSILGGVPANDRSAAPIEQVASIVQGPALAWLVRIVALLAAGGALLSLIAGIGRTLFAMGRAGGGPRALAAVSAHGVPHRAQVIAAVAAGCVVVVGGIGPALAVSAFSILTYYGIAHLSAMRLRRDEGRPPFLVPALGIVGCALIAAALVLVALGA